MDSTASALNQEKIKDETGIETENGAAELSASSTDEAASEHLHGIRLAMIIMANAVAMFLVALDRTIIATAVPKITDEFHSLDDVGWYASAYLLTSCATQLLWGRIYTFYSPKWVILVAIAFFEIGSLLCGAAPNSNAFITGRAVAGLGSAGIFSGATVLVARVVPLHKRPMYVGAMGSIFAICSVIGPLLGGAFTDKVSWRWCFYINLPLGAISVAVLVFLLHTSPITKRMSIRQQVIQLDPFGTLVFLPGIFCFLLALQWGGATYHWSDARVIALFILAGILIGLFIIIQIWQQENATVPPRIIRNRSVSCGMLYVVCAGGAMISLLYSLPIWFQAVKGNSAVQSGISLLPLVLALVTGAMTAGFSVTRTGWYNPWMFFCAVFMSIGSGLITTLQPETASAKWIGYQIIFGFGLGTGMQQSSLAAQAVLAKKDVSTGVSLMFFGQSLGGALFVCIGQSLFNQDLRSSLSKILRVDTIAVLTAGATQVRKFVTPEQLDSVLVCYNGALRKAFVVALSVSCFSLLPALGMEWKNVRKERNRATASPR